MKKLVAVIVIALVIAAAIWVSVRVQLAKRLAIVPELLPETTLVLIEAPDFQKTRSDWHESDLSKIWREPSVQEFLRKPLARLPENRGGRRQLEDFLGLRPKHGFLALTSLEKNEPKLIGGFHFDAKPEKARESIGELEAELLSRTPNATHETLAHRQHNIEIARVSHFVFASVYDNEWYFASNDLATLKALLDRADHRRENTHGSLAETAAFVAAVKHLPREYAGMVFLDPRPFMAKLMPLVALTGQSLAMDQLKRLSQLQSIAATVGFDRGKMRETDFVAMPQVSAESKLQHPLLGTAGANTFFYSDSRVHWSDNLLAGSAPAAIGLPALVQQFTAAAKAQGISLEDLRKAFGEELEIIGDWPANSHWPTLIATLPVNDISRAKKIVAALASVEIGGAPWNRSDENGAIFYQAQPFAGFIPINPAMAVSETLLFAASDAAALKAAVARVTPPAGELAKSTLFKDAAALLPAAESAFAYVDTRLLYARIDAAVRPLILMSATFNPALAKTVNPSKLPPPEVITQHLSPIVMSQRYEKDGYVTESVGPVTFREASIGAAGAVGRLCIYLRQGLNPGALLQQNPPGPTPPTLLSPTASPTPSPF
jgi:hypothetical protein